MDHGLTNVPTDLGLVDHVVGLQFDGEVHSKLWGEGAHGWQGPWSQHNAVRRRPEVGKGLGDTHNQPPESANAGFYAKSKALDNQAYMAWCAISNLSPQRGWDTKS